MVILKRLYQKVSHTGNFRHRTLSHNFPYRYHGLINWIYPYQVLLNLGPNKCRALSWHQPCFFLVKMIYWTPTQTAYIHMQMTFHYIVHFLFQNFQPTRLALGVPARGVPCIRSSCQSHLLAMSVDSLQPGHRRSSSRSSPGRTDLLRDHPAYRIRLREPRHVTK